MSTSWMPWISLKEFARYERMESHFGRRKFRKRMRELNARARLMKAKP